ARETTRPVKARSASLAEGTSRPVHTDGGPIGPTQVGITAVAGTRLALQWILVKGFRLYSFQLPDSMSPVLLFIVTTSPCQDWAPSPESNPNSPSPVTTMGRNLNDASPAQGPCDPTSYHESSKQQAEPALTFYLINASLPEVGVCCTY
ncbi:hypothetical protein HN51_001720, partial [Arachis hypogaea]